MAAGWQDGSRKAAREAAAEKQWAVQRQREQERAERQQLNKAKLEMHRQAKVGAFKLNRAKLKRASSIGQTWRCTGRLRRGHLSSIGHSSKGQAQSGKARGAAQKGELNQAKLEVRKKATVEAFKAQLGQAGDARAGKRREFPT
eukprot:1158029-Pelagomonas_calceolata.AAC.3